MPDAKSLPPMIAEHEFLFGKNNLDSLATDKGYYSLNNQLLLENKKVNEIGLPKPGRDLNAPRNPIPGDVMEKLHNRRVGIEVIIGHIKHGGQLDRSRMKSDLTTLAAGYVAVLSFNLRQLKRCVIGKVCPNFSEILSTALENDEIEKILMASCH